MLATVTRPSSLALGVLALAAWLLWSGQSSVSLAPLGRDAAPLTLGPWAGTSVQMDPRVFEILETKDVTVMEYRMGEETPVWLARVEGFGKRAAFHPPELCYVGSHFEVIERGPHEVLINGQRKRIMRLVVGQGSDQFEAWYWFTANGRVTPSYYQQQWWLMMDAIQRKPMAGTLVRISTPMEDAASSHRRLLAFATSLDAASAISSVGLRKGALPRLAAAQGRSEQPAAPRAQVDQ
jgi:EpsI family protein